MLSLNPVSVTATSAVRTRRHVYKPLEVKVDRGESGLQDGPETPEEVGCLVEEKEKQFVENTNHFSKNY